VFIIIAIMALFRQAEARFTADILIVITNIIITTRVTVMYRTLDLPPGSLT
jgi:hypothetical protein